MKMVPFIVAVAVIELVLNTPLENTWVYVRTRRLGKTTSRKDRIQSLHHDLNAAINQHRHRYPESTWGDIQKAVKYTASQVARKL